MVANAHGQLMLVSVGHWWCLISPVTARHACSRELYNSYLAHCQQVHVHAVHENPVGVRISWVPAEREKSSSPI